MSVYTAVDVYDLIPVSRQPGYPRATRICRSNVPTTFVVDCLQFDLRSERKHKSTDGSPAPEDTDNDL